MLNIIQNSNLDIVTGPSKVVCNLIKGLQKLKYPFVLNGKIESNQMIFIPNSRRKLVKILFSESKYSNIIAGPNIFVLPSDIDFLSKLALKKVKFYVQPSKWAMDVWLKLGYRLSSMNIWAVGIDTEFWQPFEKNRKKKILIYFKERNLELLENTKNILEKLKLKYSVLFYGKYNEIKYKSLLAEIDFVIWIGRHESQGIALMECLSCNIPLIVLDVKSLWDSTTWNYNSNKLKSLLDLKVTAAPYFDENCGIIINDINHLESAIDKMLSEINFFNPRKFILDNFTLEKKAMDLLNLFRS